MKSIRDMTHEELMHEIEYLRTLLDKKDVYSDSITCYKCGMVWKGIMGYVCPNSQCPIQMKISC